MGNAFASNYSANHNRAVLPGDEHSLATREKSKSKNLRETNNQYSKGQQHNLYVFTCFQMLNCEQQTRSQRKQSSHGKSLDPVSSCLESSNDCCLYHCAWPVYKRRTYVFINNAV